MLYTESDFMTYLSSFYMDSLNREGKELAKKGVDDLKRYSTNRTKCRRVLLLEYLKETPTYDQSSLLIFS